MKHYIIAFFGMSGVGKTFAQHYLQKQYHIPMLVTHTTRLPRPHEKEGVDYWFDDKQRFFSHHLLEWTKFNHTYYGSTKEDVKNLWNKHQIISATLDVNGVRTYLTKLGTSVIPVYLFSNTNIVKKRLINRGTSKKDLESRFKAHQKDLQPEYQLLFDSNINSYEIDTTVWDCHNSGMDDEKSELDKLVQKLRDD